MADRRIIYLVFLIGSIVFFWAYREWLSWILLLIVLLLPWFSLLVSLPAMLTIRVGVRCAESTEAGTQVKATLQGSGKLPLPPIKGKLRVHRLITGQTWKLKGLCYLPTDHCGTLHVTPRRVWVYDYLGLLRLPVLRKQSTTVLVFPAALPQSNPPDISRYLANAWKPKPGGGFSEHYELRLYRPGDNLRQLHWKLSAKTGRLILREPMEAVRGLALLTMELSGTPEQLDRKLGRLRWLSEYLLEQSVSHQLDCLTHNGLENFSLKHPSDVRNMLGQLLSTPAAREGICQNSRQTSWCHHIGGDSNEA